MELKGRVVSGYGVDRQHGVSGDRHTTFSMFFEDGTYIRVQPSEPVPVDLDVSVGTLPMTIELELDREEIAALREVIWPRPVEASVAHWRARDKLLKALGG